MKKFILIFAFAFLFFFGNMGHVIVYAKQPAVPWKVYANAVPYIDEYKWFYETRNGVLYRRLYDVRNQCWVGDWEVCP